MKVGEQMKWDLHEEILLVDLYYKNKNGLIQNYDEKVEMLSSVLNKRADLLGIIKDEKFRNVTGIKMKLQNIAFVDSLGELGLSSVSELDKEVVNLYKNDSSKFNDILALALDETKKPKIFIEEISFSEEFEIENCPDIDLDIFELSVRTSNCFNGAGILTLADLMPYNYKKLKNIKNFGAKCVCEVKEKIMNSDVLSNLSTKAIIAVEDKKTPKMIYSNRDYIINGDFSFADSEDIPNDIMETIEKYKQASKLIDYDLRKVAYENPLSIIPVMNSLLEFAHNTGHSLNTERKIKELLNSIPTQRRSQYLVPYLKAFGINAEILELVDETNIVDDISWIYELFVENNRQIKAICDFLEWMTFDLNDIVSVLFSKLFKTEKAEKVITLRATNHTLEFIGKEIGVTRERIRQIEAKAHRHFRTLYNQNRIFLLLIAVRNNDTVITPAEIKSEIAKHGDEFIFMLSKCDTKDFVFNKDMNVFSANNDLFTNAEVFVDSLPDELSKSDYNFYLNSAKDDGVSIEVVEKMMAEQYKHTGQLYHRNRLTLSHIYKKTLEKYYPNGMKIFDEVELDKFKYMITQDFGDVKFPNTNHAISARIADVAMLCGRGTYKANLKNVLPKDLLCLIQDYIETNDRSIFLMNTLFSVFEQELKTVGIDNRYYLQGVLKNNFSGKYIFKKDYLLKDNNDATIYEEIIKFIKKQKYPISQKDVAKEFPGITDIMVSMAVSDIDIVNLFGRYIHISSLKINDEEIRFLREQLLALTEDGQTYHAKNIYEKITSERSKILLKYFIEFPFGAFSLCERLFSDEFEFKRPYIAKKGVEIENAYERLKEFVGSIPIIEISNIIEFTKENNILVYSILNLLNTFNNTHFIYDKDIIIEIKYLGISEIIAEEIEDMILTELRDVDIIPISQLSYVYKFPTINRSWTQWLIYSTIKRFSNKLDVAVSSNQFKQAVPIVGKKGLIDEDRLSEFSRDNSGDIKFAKNLDNIDELIADYIQVDMLESEGVYELQRS